jgi:hypothetical protein
MKKIFNLIPLFFLAALFSCTTNKDATSPDQSATSTLTGKIVNEITGDGIENATVRATDGTNEKGATTDADGNYTIKIDLFKDTELTLVTYADGFYKDTSTVFAIKGEKVSVPLIKLKQSSNTGSTQSGKAASVYLFSQSATFVGVKESGSNETAQLIFEVLDSSGVPINDKNSVTVNFSFGSSPGGGEYLFPSSVKTNSLGKASCTFNSGTIAGVSEVIATITSDGKTIKSRPILIAIHGGFPDINHFHVASEKLNYPFLGGVGHDINFTAYAGDKYSNPVRLGTSIYFETTSGIIGGSNQTDNLGRATVTLLTQPYPNHSTYGKGFFVVTAKTVDENQTSITTNTLRLLSGFPLITVTPSTFSVELGSSVSFNYTVMDINNNPIASGNKISVTAKGADVELAGSTSIEMPDVLYGMTNFSFTLTNVADSAKTRPITITISSSGVNGNNALQFTGIAK